uniref:Reverse transcriptase domain-containing protein n=1 Tax=Tanacetum cinerariifolium TaxID=118510 RepID=A0A699HPZ7_TANCI|nr:reverse transcriptase domain-containing protein [Tanacetum cinerariifolium]
MSTRSSARNLFPPLESPEITIRRRSHADPTLLNDFKMATDGNGDPPVPDLKTIEELCQPSLNGQGRPIALIAIQAMDFGLKNDMIEQVQNSCQFHGLLGDDANKHLDKFLHVTQSIKVNEVTDDTLCLHPEESYDLIENMTGHQNDWDTSAQWSDSTSSITSSSNLKIVALKAKMAKINKNLVRVLQMNTTSSSGSRTLPGNTVTNPKEELKGITTRSGTAYQGPTIPTTTSSLSKVVERDTEVTKDTVPPTNNRSTNDVQPSVVQTKTPTLNSKPIVAPVAAPVSAPKPNKKPSIPYPSRLHDQKLHDKANDKKEKIFKIFQDLNFNISFVDALIMMPKFGPSIKSLLTNKEKLFELARTLLNEHCSVVILKNLPEKLGDPANQKSLIDVFKGELTLHVSKEAITFNLDQTSRYSTNYNYMEANRIDVIDMACEEYLQEVISFFDVIASGNPTSYYDSIVSTSSLTLTPFGDSDFLLEEVDAFLALEDGATSPEVDHSYFDPEGDIILFEAFMNNDPSLPPPTQGNYLPQVRKELKICKAKNDKPLIDEPLEFKLKGLPPHLECVFLEGDDKLPVVIAKDLSDEEKTALMTVLKSHKRAIA